MSKKIEAIKVYIWGQYVGAVALEPTASRRHRPVIPAQAGIQRLYQQVPLAKPLDRHGLRPREDEATGTSPRPDGDDQRLVRLRAYQLTLAQFYRA